MLGIIAMTGEYRHETITPTFLVTPRRGRAVTAKVIAYALAGLGFGTVNVLVPLAIAVPWLEAWASISPDHRVRRKSPASPRRGEGPPDT